MSQFAISLQRESWLDLKRGPSVWGILVPHSMLAIWICDFQSPACSILLRGPMNKSKDELQNWPDKQVTQCTRNLDAGDDTAPQLFVCRRVLEEWRFFPASCSSKHPFTGSNHRYSELSGYLVSRLLSKSYFSTSTGYKLASVRRRSVQKPTTMPSHSITSITSNMKSIFPHNDVWFLTLHPFNKSLWQIWIFGHHTHYAQQRVHYYNN